MLRLPAITAIGPESGGTEERPDSGGTEERPDIGGTEERPEIGGMEFCPKIGETEAHPGDVHVTARVVSGECRRPLSFGSKASEPKSVYPCCKAGDAVALPCLIFEKPAWWLDSVGLT